MNPVRSCHEISDYPGLYVDAFRSSKFWQQPEACLILSHYHGDHYGSLPRQYAGPALIHCTPITAQLLREIHEISSDYVVEHEYGDTWEYCNKNFLRNYRNRKDNEISDGNLDLDSSNPTQTCQVTFYNAHHCPGAALILMELPSSDEANGGRGLVHLHTGDMRFHENMLHYPLLKYAATERRLDTVWLDTTYALATRKHSFPSQAEAVEDAAHQVQQVLEEDVTSQNDQDTSKDGTLQNFHGCKTLILLCCYNIGKEKILWRVAQRSNRKLYANARKLRMLNVCCQNKTNNVEGNPTTEQEDDWQQLYSRYCTSNYEETNLHVVPMHMAGNVWPFFQPNYQACAQYALEHGPGGDNKECFFDRVVVFCPTGWAAANNWNRNNRIHTCAKTKFPHSTTTSTIGVEIRLLPYSEHSSLTELKTLVEEHWKPRQIVPTVYKGEAEKRQILNLFAIDRNRAKQHFLQSLSSQSARKSARNPESGRSGSCPVQTLKEASPTEAIEPLHAVHGTTSMDLPKGNGRDCGGNSSYCETEETLVSMGFVRRDVQRALQWAIDSHVPASDTPLLETALNHLLSSSPPTKDQTRHTNTTSPNNKKPLKRKRTQQTSLDGFVQTREQHSNSK